MKTVVLYYSLTKRTSIVAEALAKKLNADLKRIETVKHFSMLSAFFVGAPLSIKKRGTPIKPLEIDLSKYDRIIIGTPVWASNSVPAVNEFIDKTDFTGKEVILFAVYGGSVGKTIESMSDRIKEKGGKIVDTFGLKSGGVKKNALEEQAEKIAEKLK